MQEESSDDDAAAGAVGDGTTSTTTMAVDHVVDDDNEVHHDTAEPATTMPTSGDISSYSACSGTSSCEKLKGKKKRQRRHISHHENDVVEGASLSFEGLITPNFEELARRFPNDFGKAYKDMMREKHVGPLSSRITQEFSIALARALLRIHFNLCLPELPDRHLCPPIPNRHFYVQWLLTQVLPSTTTAVPSSNFHVHEKDDDGRNMQSSPSSTMLRGLDIGTGASCIYPLLFSALMRQQNSSNNAASAKDYKLYATEIDVDAVEIAKRNVHANHLQSHIQVLAVQPTETAQHDSVRNQAGAFHVGPLRQSLDAISTEESGQQQQQRLDFCMTNPPFFDDSRSSERTDLRIGDGRQRTAMTVSEGSYPGGEAQFVIDMIADGLALVLSRYDNQQRVREPVWSSCMCGKKTSWLYLKKILMMLLGPSHMMYTEFGPGHMTRWFLAWTFERPRIRSSLAKTTTWQFTVPKNRSPTSSSGDGKDDDAMDEIVDRLVEYFRAFTAADLTWNVGSRSCREISVCEVGRRNRRLQQHQQLQAREKEPALALPDRLSDGANNESRFPDRIQQLLDGLNPQRRMALFLPPEGHFIVDALVSSATSSMSENSSNLHIKAYQHSDYGSKVVEKMKNQMEGEICRTNRRWRRKLKREQLEMQPQQQQQQQVPQPMDIS